MGTHIHFIYMSDKYIREALPAPPSPPPLTGQPLQIHPHTSTHTIYYRLHHIYIYIYIYIILHYRGDRRGGVVQERCASRITDCASCVRACMRACGCT